MALAEKNLAANFNQSNHTIVDHYTYVFTGDGCLMEGISHEACSLAGTLGLGKLIVFYDDNGISIDGPVDGWFTDDTPKRFESYNWQVIRDVNGHDSAFIKQAIDQARANHDQPTLICCKTVIGFGSPNKAGKESAHGAPLGEEEIMAMREQLEWPHPAFDIPQAVYDGWCAVDSGQQSQNNWQAVFDAYKLEHAALAEEFRRRMAGDLPQDWGRSAISVISDTNDAAQTVATRKASQFALNGFGPCLPELIGGSADLTGSNYTNWSVCDSITKEDASGNYIYYGVREFGMCAINNGLALHGGFIPYGGTFLMFSEYARNALRMAALMGIQNICVFSHDSIGLGEDGPTHQAVEQAATLRLMPKMSVWRPSDTLESAVAWQFAIERKNGPTSLLFSRQNAKFEQRDADQVSNIRKGAYVLSESATPQAIIIGTGTEVGLAMEAQALLEDEGISVSVVSMPCTDVFDAQDEEYQQSVLPTDVPKIAVEAGIADYWTKYTGTRSNVVGIDGFGESAPGNVVYDYLGVTTKNVVNAVKQAIK
jgi:transketolase